MSARAPVLLLLAALAGCQSANPYRASHQPYPPAPLDPAAARQADPGSYPAGVPHDFGRYRHWQWAEHMAEPLAGIVSAELDQRGLRPASAQQPADLYLRAQQHSVTRQQQVYDYPYLDAGYGYYGHHPGYWGAATYPLVRTVTYQVEEVQLEFFDPRNGALVWTSSGEATRGTSDDRSQSDTLRRAVRRALSGFPPP